MQGPLKGGGYDETNQEAKHQFLRDLSRNVVRGQAEAAKNGSWVGTRPYGYVIVGGNKEKRLKLGDPTHIKIVQRIFREFVQGGRSMNNIAERLTAAGIPSSGGRERWRASAIKCILENPVYIGTFRSNTHSYGKYHTCWA